MPWFLSGCRNAAARELGIGEATVYRILAIAKSDMVKVNDSTEHICSCEYRFCRPPKSLLGPL
jgi:hypothetical protein